MIFDLSSFVAVLNVGRYEIHASINLCNICHISEPASHCEMSNVCRNSSNIEVMLLNY